jgi:hypothetical protein
MIHRPEGQIRNSNTITRPTQIHHATRVTDRGARSRIVAAFRERHPGVEVRRGRVVPPIVLGAGRTSPAGALQT